MATRTISILGGNWNTLATWDEGAVPTSSDDVVARGDGLSGNLTVDVSAACLSINMTNYTGTLTMNAATQLAVSGNFTFVAGMTFTDNSTAGIVINGTSTFNTGGKTLKALTFSAAATLASDVTTTGTLTTGGSAFSGSFNFYVQGDLVANNFAACVPTINFTGSANQEWIGGGNNYNFPSTIINKSGGTLTISGTLYVGFANTPTITYTAGTVVTTGHTLGLRGSGATVTLNTGTLAWNNVTVGSFESPTVTLTGNLRVDGVLTIASGATLSPGSNTITCAANFTRNGTFTAGTSTVTFNGTSTVAGSTTFNHLTINAAKTVHLTSTQTFTVSGNFTATGSLGNEITLDATTGGSRANLPVSGTTTGVSYVNATDIDSSGGTNVANPNGTNTNTVNWGPQLFNVNLSQSITATNSMMNDFLKYISQSVSVSDTEMKEFLKNISDLVTVSESNSKEFLKIISDSITANNTLSKDFTKNISQIITLSEDITKEFLKNISDSVAVTESQAIVIAYGISAAVTFILKGMIETHDKLEMNKDTDQLLWDDHGP